MATLKDVAKEAGLTVTTVSRVLNNRGYISDNARQKVAKAMEKLNYRPNELARSLQNKSTNMIGVIVPHIRHPYFAEMISNLEHEAYKKGYRILLCNSQCEDEREKNYIEICTSNRVAGIILFSGTIQEETFSELEVPLIMVERYSDMGIASVECDNYEGGALAAKKLVECGCKHLLYIGGTSGYISMPADRRTDGFRDFCEQNQVPFTEFLTDEVNFNDMSYAEVLEKALREHPETDGVFANSDVIASQILQVCRKLGIAVPKDIKIVGFDDASLASLTTPMLTTIHQPISEMAECAINLLDGAVNGKVVAKRTVLPVCLMERETT